MTEEHKQNLIENPENDNLDDESDSVDLNEIPTSSRVKKVLYWNHDAKAFEIDDKDLEELRVGYFKKETDMQRFELMYRDFPRDIHPQVKGLNVPMAVGLWSGAVIVLFWVLYTEFIIF